MKKTITKNCNVCDSCEKECYPSTCFGCGKEHCYDCATKLGITYNHAVHFQGSGDGYYCKPCDIGLSEAKSDELHEAYVGIRALRDESDRFYADWKIRSELVEATIKRLNSNA